MLVTRPVTERRNQLVGSLLSPGLLLVVGMLAGSPALAVAGPLSWVAVARSMNAARLRKEEQACEIQLLTVVDQLGHELRSGNSLANAFISAASQAERSANSETGSVVDETLAGIAASVDAGERLEAAMRRLLEGEGWAASNEGMRLLLVSMIVLVESGGSAVAAIDRLADTLRSRQAGVEETRAQASQATASAYVLGGLPLIFGLVLAAANSSIASFYAFTLGGAFCVVLSLALIAAGWSWISRLVWR